MCRTLRILLYLSWLCLLAGCASVKLINTNQEFVSLMQQSAEAERLREAGTLDPPAFDTAMEGLRVSFAANGDEAARAARAAETDQSKASLFNVAVRSYLKSGALGDAEIPTIAREGINACSRMSGLDALPTTCGYFYIVIPQAVNNEWQRKVAVIKRKEKGLSIDENLSVADGEMLVEAAGQFFKQLTMLTDAEGDIDFGNAGENLRSSFTRQQDIFFCNARTALNTLDLVVKTGENWDRDDEMADARAPEAGHLASLQQRHEQFPIDTCERL